MYYFSIVLRIHKPFSM